MDITFTIPDDKITEFKLGFLKANPVPLDDAGNPEMTEVQWFRIWVKRVVMCGYRNGKEELAQEGVIIDEDVIS